MPVRTVTETYTYLRQSAPAFAQQIAVATAAAHNEAELRDIRRNLAELRGD